MENLVICPSCEAEGPRSPSKAPAIAAWNTRPQEEALVAALRLCEHKIDQHLQGQYADGRALGEALHNARAVLADLEAADGK